MFLDSEGNVLYVGKSKSLRKRIASYFYGENEQKISVMLHSAAEIVCKTTETDIEAMLLEYRLIKAHQPPYNARMKRDRQTWYLNIGLNEPLPSLTISREPFDQPGLSFGPFANEGSVEYILETIGEYWKLPTCRQVKFSTKKSCLRMHMHTCHAPCKNSEPEEYQVALEKACSFLLGETYAVFDELKSELQNSVDTHDFEQAAKHLKRLNALTDVSKQVANTPPPTCGELVVLIESYHEEGCMLFYLSDGHALARKRYFKEEDQSVNEFMTYIRLTGNLNEPNEESRILGNAVMEIDAKRKYFRPQRALDVTNDGMAKLSTTWHSS